VNARPPFIRSAGDVPEKAHVYPNSTEKMGPVRRLGKEAGLERIGIHLQRLPPGGRSSWPHAEENEEDLAAFPAGTGISHCFINNGTREALLLVGGEAPKKGSRIVYPLNPSRRTDMQPSDWWDDAPPRELGPHDGLPDALR
jgi:uncharacterized cupin superfamily protein